MRGTRKSMNVIEEIKNDMTGIELLDDWIGAGGMPVHQMVADFRAQRCIHGNEGDKCPLNVEPGWWDRVKSVIAHTIKRELEIKNRLKLKVAEEESLAIIWYAARANNSI